MKKLREERVARQPATEESRLRSTEGKGVSMDNPILTDYSTAGLEEGIVHYSRVGGK